MGEDARDGLKALVVSALDDGSGICVSTYSIC